MNLILFDDDELGRDLDYEDPRAVHIRDILHLEKGDDFAAGIIGGPRGRARLNARGVSGWKWTFNPLEESPPLLPLTLILGCPRPPVARRLLKDMSSLGLREIRVSSTDLNEKSYLSSKLWREGLWRDALIEGAVQKRILEDLPGEMEKIAMDNDEGLRSFGDWNRTAVYSAAVLAIGPERGWSSREREILDSTGFNRLHMGKRILRTETACSVASALILSSMGYY